MIRRIDCPIASVSVYPKIRSAAAFHEVIVPVRSLLMMASSEEATMAARRNWASFISDDIGMTI